MKFSPSRLLAAGVAAGICAAPIAARAQSPSYATNTETVRGTIASVQDVNHFLLNDDRGFVDNITLRPGASVVSAGVQLVPGERVAIDGSAAGPTFVATSIATTTPPATASYPAPAYYPAPVYYAAPRYYGYAPFSVGLFFHFR